MSKNLRIIFMGTPDFAVPSLEILIDKGYNVVGVITAVDKAAGRGKKISESAIKKYAISKKLKVLQPSNLKDENFIRELKGLQADLQIVVAFRMLPEIVWAMPPMGTFNLHASLLPHYRGAAPINWAIINGETETGCTTFFLEHEIDTGNIISSEKINIHSNQSAGDIHDKLMKTGANLLIKSIELIQNKNFKPKQQTELLKDIDKIKTAPKIFKEDCRINWDQDIIKLHNFIRGLSPYPTAFSEFVSPENKKYSFKIFKTSPETIKSNKFKPDCRQDRGKISTDGKNYLSVQVNKGQLFIEEIQIAGKKRMFIKDFLRGFTINNDWIVN